MRLADKIAFLKRPESYPRATSHVEICETHTAIVFLTDDRAYKLKKPVRLPYLDFSTLGARGHFCREEARLNRRLAPGIYLGVVALREGVDGSLTVGGPGQTVDWLVEMLRLPEDDMLDRRLTRSRVERPEIEMLAERLAAFYAEQRQECRPAQSYVRHLLRESAINRDHLEAMRQKIGGRHDGGKLARLCGDILQEHVAEIEARARRGLVVDGHGDLRPEHVCLVRPLVIFDRLDFDADMRLIDIYDEVNYLGLECERLGCDWIRALLLGHMEKKIGHPPSPELLSAYGLFRLLLRARLAIDHLLDAHPRQPDRWPPMTRAYLDCAQRHADMAVS